MSVSNMTKKSIFNFIISCISLQLVHCNGSSVPYFMKRRKEEKSDKKSEVNNLNNTIEAKIFCLNCYHV